MDRKTADKFIVVFDELGGDDSTSSQIGISALYEIATLPPEERERPHTIPSTGATKTVDEMTVRELREVKAALKEERERCEREREAREKAEARAHLPRVFRGFYAKSAAFTCAECYRRGNGVRAVI